MKRFDFSLCPRREDSHTCCWAVLVVSLSVCGDLSEGCVSSLSDSTNLCFLEDGQIPRLLDMVVVGVVGVGVGVLSLLSSSLLESLALESHEYDSSVSSMKESSLGSCCVNLQLQLLDHRPSLTSEL